MENFQFIENELNWLASVLDTRMSLNFGNETVYRSVFELSPPKPEGDGAYAQLIRHWKLSAEERLCLILAFSPLLRPQILQPLEVANPATQSPFPEFGCIKSDSHCLLPTLATFLFLVAGNDLDIRLKLISFFDEKHLLFSHHFIDLKKYSVGASIQEKVLQPTDEAVYSLLLERKYQPVFSNDFPARLVTTAQSWEELVLEPEASQRIDELKDWLYFGQKMLIEWQLNRYVSGGYRVLFHGPPGTGKSMTVRLLGKNSGRDVFRVDLSQVVSKYIGETEKNLSRIFDKAELRDWILFFDEADALFGKRTDIKDAHDRFANQEISFLLQRIEDFSGLVILASNLKSNLDEAFLRRFQSVVYFNVPGPKLRVKLWQNYFSKYSILDNSIDIEDIAARYELTGGEILNVVLYASLRAFSKNEKTIRLTDLLNGIKMELAKEGRTVS